MRRILLLPLLLFSCTIDQKNLIGNWQAVAYYEMGQSVNTPLDSVRLSFSTSKDYSFQSIGQYEEKGQYRLSGSYLFLRDTTVQNVVEKAFKVNLLTADSLKIGMITGGKKGAVFFGKTH